MIKVPPKLLEKESDMIKEKKSDEITDERSLI